MKPENCIFVLDNKKKEKEQSDNQELFYTILGQHDFIDSLNNPRLNNENFALAKKITNNNVSKYYVKIGAYGRLFNPMGMFSEGKNEKFLSKIGRKEYEFKQVNNRIFDMYLSFLSSKNIAWLNNAEREMV
jgi:hypothetical protein